jgi:hypothetical protein
LADLIIDSLDIVTNNIASKIEQRQNLKTSIQTGSQIALYPLYGENNSYDSDKTLIFPISPSDVMFNEDSDSQTIKLINYGELPVGMNRKLATWSIDSFFPIRINTGAYSNSGEEGYVTDKKFKYWFDISKGTELPYDDYCNQLLTWKNNQTPLVFFFQTWGGYYNCQIKKFNYGRKDSIGNVYYQIDFQEYIEYTNFDSGSASTDYSSDTYYPAEGENILQIAKKLYGDSDYYTYFMNLNSITNPLDIKAGQAYKVR